MADDRAYRILVKFDAEHERFHARVPELEVEATGDTRAAALEAAESAIEQKFEAAATDPDNSLPPPVDVEPIECAVSIDLAEPIARELKYHADRSKMTADALADQLLIRAIGLLNTGLRPPPRPRPEKSSEPEKKAEGGERNERNERGGRKGRGGRGGRQGRRDGGYRPEIEDQANFLAYVRDMEKGGGRRR
ncbi:MAG: hypothetical protein AAFV29_22690 [Myxococcota bacterium]